MLLDGHSASSVSQRLGLSGPAILYRWKTQQLQRSGPVAVSLDDRVRELEAELLRVTRERDILKKALAIFGRNE
jgi:transposase